MEFILPTRAGYVNHWKKRVAELQLTETQNLGGSRSGKKKKKKKTCERTTLLISSHLNRGQDYGQGEKRDLSVCYINY